MMLAEETSGSETPATVKTAASAAMPLLVKKLATFIVISSKNYFL
jgi:hypothetical protein